MIDLLLPTRKDDSLFWEKFFSRFLPLHRSFPGGGNSTEFRNRDIQLHFENKTDQLLFKK